MLDIAVAGCGPAGLASALLLSRRGQHVVLYDQFNAPKPLGSGLMLQPTGLSVLAHLGLADQMMRFGQPVERLFGKAVASGRTVLDVDFTLGSGRPLAVHRAALFRVLYDAVLTAGLPIETGRKVVTVERGGASRPSLTFSDGRRSPAFDLVIDSLGSRSPLMPQAAQAVARRPLAYGALWANVEWHARSFRAEWLEQRYSQANVMIGVLPVGLRHEGDTRKATFFWSLRPTDHAAWRQAGLGPWKERILALWPEMEPIVGQISDPDAMILAAYGHHTLPVPFGDRIAFVGDSAHSTSPQLGQGANMALLDAMALARALELERDLEAALRRYGRLRRLNVRLYQAMSALFTPFYQSDSRVLPIIRDLAFPLVDRVPGGGALLASLVTGQIANPLKALGLKSVEAPPPVAMAEGSAAE